MQTNEQTNKNFFFFFFENNQFVPLVVASIRNVFVSGISFVKRVTMLNKTLKTPSIPKCQREICTNTSPFGYIR